MMLRRLTLLAAATLALALGACRSAPETAPVQAAAESGERTTARYALAPDLKPVAATVTTRDMSEARARIGGTLTSLRVKEGDYVRKGQVIAVVSDQRLVFETSAMGSQAAAAEAEQVRADADLARVRVLYDKGYYAKARLDQAEATARAARGQAAAARSQQAAGQELSRQGAVLAPADGRVLHATTPVGSVVTQGQSIATLTAGEPLLRVEIPEGAAGALKVGDSVALEAADLDDLGGVAPSGVIIQLYPAVTAGQVTADIRVTGLKADRVGQRVRVKIKVGERRAILLPSRFVATRFGVDYVRVVGPDGRAGDVAVQTTPGPAPGEVEILSGLNDGDVVLAAGARP
jgi:RND family efflux transporter MFP subunit